MTKSSLTEDAMCMVMRSSITELKDIYEKFKEDGIICMQFLNIYLAKWGGCLGLRSDIDSIAPDENKKIFKHFFDWMIKQRKIILYKDFFYLPERNKILGFPDKPSSHDISLMLFQRGSADYMAPYTKKEISFTFKNLITEVTAPLPRYIQNAEKGINISDSTINTDVCMRLSEFYLNHSMNCIGSILDSDITSKIMIAKRHKLYLFLEKDSTKIIDRKNNIFYDPRLRAAYGMEPVPSQREINEVRSNYTKHVRFMNKKTILK